MIKHLLKVFIATTKRIVCRHSESYEASCPYTGKTYISCRKCLKRLAVK